MERYRIQVYLDSELFQRVLAEDVQRGLSAQPKTLLPKYFYDSRGSALFERITQLPEYYLTRAEHSLLAPLVQSLMAEVQPREIVELGSGASKKIKWFLDALDGAEQLVRYIPFDMDAESVEVSAQGLTADYPSLQVNGIVGDFESHLVHVPPREGLRLVILLGSTIGNLHPQARHDLLIQVRQLLTTHDRLLLGLDLVKDQAVLEAAYNDSAGVTAEFNRNILRVINRALHADFQPEAFRHYSYYNSEAQRVEMHLIPDSLQTVDLRDLGLRIQILPGEKIWTESSYKFTRESTFAMLKDAGLKLEHWYSDSANLFALALVARGC